MEMDGLTHLVLKVTKFIEIVEHNLFKW